MSASPFSDLHRARDDGDVLHVTSSGSRPTPASGGLGTDDQALLKRASMVDLTQEDKQNGYDVSLLSLQPRGGTAPTDSSSAPLSNSSRPSTSHTFNSSPHSSYPPQSGEAEEETLHSDGDEEALPLSASYTHTHTHTHKRNLSASSIPSISNSNPRNAATAYLQRAQMSESRLGKYTSGMSASVYSDEGDGDGVEEAEKGVPRTRLNVTDRRGGRGGRHGKKQLWQRKGLLLFLGVLVLVVCAALGIGLGVGITRLNSNGGKNEDDKVKAADVSSSSHSSPFLPNPATSTIVSPGDPEFTAAAVVPPIAQPATSSSGWVDPAAGSPTTTTEWAEAAPTTAGWTDTDAVAATGMGWSGEEGGQGGEGDAAGGGGWVDGEGVWHSA